MEGPSGCGGWARGRLSHRRSRRLPAGCERPDQTTTADATPSTADLGSRRNGNQHPKSTEPSAPTHAGTRVFIYMHKQNTPDRATTDQGGADAATRPPGRPTTQSQTAYCASAPERSGPRSREPTAGPQSRRQEGAALGRCTAARRIPSRSPAGGEGSRRRRSISVRPSIDADDRSGIGEPVG